MPPPQAAAAATSSSSYSRPAKSSSRLAARLKHDDLIFIVETLKQKQQPVPSERIRLLK
jgi:hypothetical protein